MKIEQNQLDTCEVQLKVEVDKERVDSAKRAAARRLSQKYNIPGFRKGKAPFEVVLRTFGESVVMEEAMDDLGQAVYQAALDEAELEPFAPGRLVDAKLGPVVFTYHVPLQPTVDLGEYRSARLDYVEPEVTEEALEAALERMREQQAVLEPVERPAQVGDVVTLDIVGVAKAPATPAEEAPAGPGEEMPDAEAPAPAGEGAQANAQPDPADEFLLDDKGVDVLLDPKLNWPAPGFAETVVGIRLDEQRHVELRFPEEYENESLRGRMAHFEVKCTGIKSRSLPDWDDELARSLGDYDSLADLRMKAREQLLALAKRRYHDEYSRSALDVIVAGAAVKYPPVLLEQELDELVDDLDRRLREQRLTLNDYLKIQQLTMERLREDLEPRARERLRRSLVLSQLIEREGLDVGDEEVEQHIEAMLSTFGASSDSEKLRQALSSEASRRSARLNLLSEKAVERAVAIARGEAPVPPPSGPDSPGAIAEGAEADAAAAEAAPGPTLEQLPSEAQGTESASAEQD